MTISRSDYLLDLELVALLREFESLGVSIGLSSNNSYPVVKALHRYLGFSGPIIAEYGCVVEIGSNLRILTEKRVPSSIYHEILSMFSLPPDWQEPFRLVDKAIPCRDPLIAEKVKKYTETKYKEFKAIFSGFAIHIVPRECSKGHALRCVANELGIPLEDIIAIGDSEVDLDMIEVAGIGVATGDADEIVKHKAKVVLPFKASEGVKYFLHNLRGICLKGTPYG